MTWWQLVVTIVWGPALVMSALVALGMVAAVVVDRLRPAHEAMPSPLGTVSSLPTRAPAEVQPDPLAA
jgi:hypothetical protein